MLTFYDKSRDRDKPVHGSLRVVQERNPLGVYNMGFCDCGTADRPCMDSAVVLLCDEDNHAFLLCEYHERQRKEQAQ